MSISLRAIATRWGLARNRCLTGFSTRWKQDADILFILTTNRPEQLESALASRPGRIDQAIEVPLPDDIGRGKLVRLYGKGLPLDAAVVDEGVRRTEGVSAAFIKELMRRIAQSAIVRDGGKSATSADIDEALND